MTQYSLYTAFKGSILNGKKRNKWAYIFIFLMGCSVTIFAQSSIELQDAAQSSTYPQGLAYLAIDGNTDGKWSGKSITHTMNQKNPWWEGDLGGIYDISSIQIFNRTDCCKERLDNIEIYTMKSQADEKVLFATIQYSELTGASITKTGNVTGRFVHIVRKSNVPAYLSLAEVKVFGTPVDQNTNSNSKFNTKMVYKTGCGGSRVYPDDISAASSTVLWKINTAWHIERSVDGGKTWKMPTDKKMQEVSGVSADVAWGIYKEKIFYTTDGGKNWTQTTGGATKVSAIDAMTAWVVNGNSKRIYFTKDAGKSWTYVKGAAQDVSATFQTAAWVSNQGNVWHTKNAGTNWKQVNNHIKVVSALNNLTAWCIDDKNNIQYTNNGGQTWTKDTDFYYDVAVLSSSQAFAINACGDLVLLTVK